MGLTFADYIAQDATALAELVRRGDVTAAELIEVAISRAEAVNPAINAIAYPLFDEARALAKQSVLGPFAGVPFSIKDLNHPVAGAPLTHGSRAFIGNIAADDGEGTERFKAAGLIPICISTSPEFGLSVTTESTLFGATANPWDLTRSSGGSSGGAAALVAAGVMPMAHATDGGGSIRVPASCCGLFGLKPSRGRTPIGHLRTEGWGGLTASFAVTRSVRDAARLLDATCGAPHGARSVAPCQAGSYAAELEGSPKRLRIGVPRSLIEPGPLDPECRIALDRTIRLLQDLGHDVEDCTLDLAGLAEAMTITVATHTAALLDSHGLARGRTVTDDELEPVTAALVALGRAIPATELIRADAAFQLAAIRMAACQTRFDMLLTPTLAQPPARLGEVALTLDPISYGAAFARYCPFTAIANQTGQPAMSLPLHWSMDGLPVGSQFFGRLGEEGLLLSLAAELERAQPWFDRRPTL